MPNEMEVLGPIPPSSISRPLVRRLISTIGAGEPLYIDVSVQENCKVGDCFNNVHRLIEAGGEMILGWCIWERPNLYARAEHHAVWRAKPASSFIDPTPNDGGYSTILFLPDPRATWDGVGHKGRKSVWEANKSKREAIDLVRLEIHREVLFGKGFGLPDGDELDAVLSELAKIDKRLDEVENVIYRKGLTHVR